MNWGNFSQWGPWVIGVLVLATASMAWKIDRIAKVHDRVVDILLSMPAYREAIEAHREKNGDYVVKVYNRQKNPD